MFNKNPSVAADMKHTIKPDVITNIHCLTSYEEHVNTQESGTTRTF